MMQLHFSLNDNSIAYFHCCPNVVQVQHEGVMPVYWIELIEGGSCVTWSWVGGREKRGREWKREKRRYGEKEGRKLRKEGTVTTSVTKNQPCRLISPSPPLHLPDWMSMFASSLCCSTGNKTSDVTPNTCNITPKGHHHHKKRLDFIPDHMAWEWG